MKRNLLLAVALMSFASLKAEVKMPTLFSDNMILQQETVTPIWGTTDSKKGAVKITTSWNNKSYTAKADKQGNWRIGIETPSYGGPYTVTVSDGAEVVLDNVLIGEVWIASGQSNMEMTMRGFGAQPVEGGNRDITLSKDDQLRIMTIARSQSQEPTMSIDSEGWFEASPGVVCNTSATAYYFARMMREVLDIPVGILCTSWGGTSIDCWMDKATATKYPEIVERDKKIAKDSQRQSANIFNAMIHPIAGFAAKGFLWYQGESDRQMYPNYQNKMVDMVALWRDMWDDEDMPFYFVQIAPYNYTRYRVEDDTTPFIREMQLNAASEIANTGMACLSDAGNENTIHPSRKYLAGERLAYQALNKTYGIAGIAADGPVYKSMKIEDGAIRLSFTNTERGLALFGKELSDFEIAGEDGKFVPAKAEIIKNGVVVSSDQVKEPKNVRYGFKAWFDGSLYNGAGLPASSFRTDK